MSDNICVGLIGYGYVSKIFYVFLIVGMFGLELVVIFSSDEIKVKVDWLMVMVVFELKYLFNDFNIDLIVIFIFNDIYFLLVKVVFEVGKYVVVDKFFIVILL